LSAAATVKTCAWATSIDACVSDALLRLSAQAASMVSAARSVAASAAKTSAEIWPMVSCT
jgi:hypothetical protein